ncbi:hypothetical protein FJY94_06590 [Candidatus Kaiserbacteria bacterium]|nr:hypothetical protein [Candidatus Kaiserbacteria bacterium]
MKVQYELGDNVYWDDPKNNPSPESIYTILRVYQTGVLLLDLHTSERFHAGKRKITPCRHTVLTAKWYVRMPKASQ